MFGYPLLGMIGMNLKRLHRIFIGGFVCMLLVISSDLSVASENNRPIQVEVVITDQYPRYLAKGAPDENIELHPINIVNKGRYGAQVRFSGCTPDNTGKCKAQVLYILLDPQGHKRFSSGWLRLWYDRPPVPIGETRIGEEGMGGEIKGEPPGSWEVVAVVRDQVSGLVSTNIASFAVPAPLLSAGHVGASHCHVDESVLFTCRSGPKQISVCASTDALRKTGYLAYRFGRPSQRPEIDFPSSGTNPATVFSYFASSYAKGGTELLQFSIGEFTYQVFSEHHAFDWNGSGVVVNRGKKRVAYFLCNEKSLINNLHQLKFMGLPNEEFTDFVDHEPAK
ncbi:MAG: hypothetical protein C4550_04015 [Nitrospiraceae bacterium]|nr:MAG: hypothetical protein C4550_04015 [Nitrospiraceae bacterium]